MRISDWSSDVCSSDLGPRQVRRPGRHHLPLLDALGDGRRGESASRGRCDTGAAGLQTGLQKRTSLHVILLPVIYPPRLSLRLCPCVPHRQVEALIAGADDEIGQASSRERGGWYVSISEGGVL